MKLLFITRKYPPMIGGMEKVSYALAKEFSKKVDTTVVAWGKSQKYLPFFLIKAFVQALYIIPTKKITNIHLGDGMLSPLGLILKRIFKTKTTVTIHGLDITFKQSLYQAIIPKCVAKMDKVICVSNATLQECVKRGISKEKCAVIPWGVYPNEFKINATRKDLEKIVEISLDNKKVLITVGRLVKRKGVYWFIKNVFPKLNDNYIYLVIGEGPERERIENIINKLNLNNRIKLLGRVSDKELKIIYNTADIFVMPNIKVEGDMEGFGIVAIEAASTGLPVIASDLEGIKDAIIEGKTGKLVKYNSRSELLSAIKITKFNKKHLRKEIFKKYSWTNIVKFYKLCALK